MNKIKKNIYLILIVLVISLPSFCNNNVYLLIRTDSEFLANDYTATISYEGEPKEQTITPINGYIYLDLDLRNNPKVVAIEDGSAEFADVHVTAYNSSGTIFEFSCHTDDPTRIELPDKCLHAVRFLGWYNWRYRLKLACYASFFYLMFLTVYELLSEKKRLSKKQGGIIIFAILFSAVIYHYDTTTSYSEISIMENAHTGVSNIVDNDSDSIQSFHSDTDFEGIGLYLATYETAVSGDYVSHLYDESGVVVGESLLKGASIHDNQRYFITYGNTFGAGNYSFDLEAINGTTDTLVIWQDTGNPYPYGEVILNGEKTDIDWSFSILTDKPDFRSLVWSEIRFILLLVVTVCLMLSYFNKTTIYKNVILFGVVLSIILAVTEVPFPKKYELYMALISMAVLILLYKENSVRHFISKQKLLPIAGLFYIGYSYFYLNKTNIHYYYGLICSFFLIINGYLFYNLSDEIKRGHLFQLWTVLFILIICAILCFHLGFDPIGEYLKDTHSYYREKNRLVGAFVHPSLLAGFIVMSIILSMSVLKNKILLILISAVQLYALILTETRMAWISIILCFGIYLVRYIRRTGINKLRAMDKQKRIMAIVASIILVSSSFVGVIVSPVGNRIIERTINTPLTKDSSTGVRVINIQVMMRIISDTPIINKLFGTGILSGNQALWSDAEYCSKLTPYIYGIDNGYLSTLYDFGIVGCILLLIVIGLGLRIIFDKKTAREDMLIALLLLGLEVTMTSYDMLYFTNVSYFVFILVGIVLGIYDKNYRTQRSKLSR